MSKTGISPPEAISDFTAVTATSGMAVSGMTIAVSKLPDILEQVPEIGTEKQRLLLIAVGVSITAVSAATRAIVHRYFE